MTWLELGTVQSTPVYIGDGECWQDPGLCCESVLDCAARGSCCTSGSDIAASLNKTHFSTATLRSLGTTSSEAR